MDSGFFAKEILDYLEMKGLHYIIACRFNNRIKYSLTHERKWIELTDGLEISETIYQANGWEKPRRIVMVRQEIEKRPKAAGKQIKAHPTNPVECCADANPKTMLPNDT